MPVTCLELVTDSWANHRFIVESNNDDANAIVESFAALVATGQIGIKHILHRYPDSELFEDTEERSIDHSYEELVNAQPRLYAAPNLKPKSDLLIKMEKRTKKKETA